MPNNPKKNKPAKTPSRIKKLFHPIVSDNQIIIIGITYLSRGFVTSQLKTYQPPYIEIGYIKKK